MTEDRPPSLAQRRYAAREFDARQVIVPVPIRSGVTVRIRGIPHDLTRAEADKLARVVMALVGWTADMTPAKIIPQPHARTGA